MSCMQELPLVTVVTPSYNQGKYIEAAVESVLSQDYPKIEYIIIDGESQDYTSEIIQKYEKRLRFISEKDHGQSDAINKGFRLAKGEILAWLNADDVYEPGCIRKAVEALQKDPALGLVYADGYIIDENGNKVKKFEAAQEFHAWELIHVQDYILQPTTFFWKSCFEKAGRLNERLNWCMDWDLWIRMSKIAEVKYIPEFFACSREYYGTKTSTGGRKRLLEIKKLMQTYSGQKRPAGYGLYWTGELAQKYSKNKIIRFSVKLINIFLFIIIKFQRKMNKKDKSDDI